MNSQWCTKLHYKNYFLVNFWISKLKKKFTIHFLCQFLALLLNFSKIIQNFQWKKKNNTVIKHQNSMVMYQTLLKPLCSPFFDFEKSQFFHKIFLTSFFGFVLEFGATFFEMFDEKNKNTTDIKYQKSNSSLNQFTVMYQTLLKKHVSLSNYNVGFFQHLGFRSDNILYFGLILSVTIFHWCYLVCKSRYFIFFNLNYI